MKYIFSVIYQFLHENYFSSMLDGRYAYLDFSGTNTTLLILAAGLLIGIIAASFMIYYQKTVIGRFVRRLLLGKHFTPETAVSLDPKEHAVKRELCSRASVLRKLVSYVEDGVVYDYHSELSARLGVATESTAEEGAPPEGEEKSDTPAPSEEEQKSEKASARKGKGFRNFTTQLFTKGPALKVRHPNFDTALFFLPEELSYRAELRYGKRGVSKKSLVLTIVVCIILFFLALRFIPVFVNMLDVTIGNVIGGI